MEAENHPSMYSYRQELAGQPLVERTTALLSGACNAVRTSLGWLFELGSTSEMTIYQKRNLVLMNRVSFFSLLLAFPGTFLLMLMGLQHSIALLTGGMLAAGLVMGLNGARKVSWSEALFAYIPAVLILIFTMLELDTNSNWNMLLLVLSRQGMCFALLLPVLIYGDEDHRKILQIGAVNVLIFLVYEAASMRLGAFENQYFSGLEHGLFSLFSAAQYLVFAACIVYMQNSSRQKELQAAGTSQKMQRLAIRDGLTGLYNHAFMEEMIGDAINRSRRSRNPLSLLMIDVDFFKQVNDTYGHNAGDTVLKELVQVLKSNKRSTDYLGRWGGDELVMLLTDTNLNGAGNLSEKLRQVVASHPFPYCKSLTISLGAGEYVEGDTPLGFVGRADAAMYRAKRGGRNRSANAAPGN